MLVSTQNPQYKQFLKLATQPKVRRRSGQSVLHGVHLISAYLDQGGVPEHVIYSEGAEADHEAAIIIRRSQKLGVSQLIMPTHTQRAVSGVENGVGLACIIKTPLPTPPDTLAVTALLLDRVQDPTNVGALIRTAAAAGVEHVYLSSGSASGWSPRALRAGMGGQFASKLYEDCDLKQVIAQTTIPVVATKLDATRSVYSVDLSGSVVWLFGNEGQGIDSQIEKLVTQSVIIPQASAVESLNVAASAAVCLFEQRRQQLEH